MNPLDKLREQINAIETIKEMPEAQKQKKLIYELDWLKMKLKIIHALKQKEGDE